MPRNKAAAPDPAADLILNLTLGDERATERLAEDLAAALAPGDCLALSGDLGTGKSTLARALIRTLADDPELEVPSPTFTLVQTYGLPRYPVSHFDLYRLEEPEEIDELGLDEIMETGAALIEWPERAAGRLPADSIHIRIEPGGEPFARRVRITAPEGAGFGARLARSLAVRHFLDQAGSQGAARRYLQGDASSRTYETIRHDGTEVILMNMPARSDDRPVRDGLPYPRLVHLAESVRPFVAVGEELRRHGFSAPEIFAADLDQGFLLIEDLGREGVIADGAPIADRYLAAAELLADFHGERWPEEVPLPDGTRYRLSPYDHRALSFETELYTDWYLPFAGEEPTPALREEFHALWQAALATLDGGEITWVLRDYHSPNLIWRDERAGRDRLGLIDFQDAVLGSPAYDLGSLGFDARVTVPQDLERAVFSAYTARRAAADPSFDTAAFAKAYAVLSAQRLTKILGIFVRLARRDGKPAYLRHLPRLHTYLDRALDHAVLSDLKLWYERRRRVSG